MNRILWNRRPKNVRDGGEIDELVLHDVSLVHIEQMDGRCWWIGVTLGDGSEWMGNFHADSRGRMSFSEQESDVDWERDEEHRGMIL